MSRRRRVVWWVVGVVLPLVLLVTAALIAMAVNMPGRGPGRFVAFRPDLPGDLKPGQRITLEGHRMQDTRELEPYTFSFSTNSLGFRGLEVDLQPDTHVVMTIGDGYAFGTSVDGDHALCDELNRLFPERLKGRGLACVNAALPGMNLVDEHAYLLEKGHKLKPWLFIIVMSYDDVWEMARPVQVRELTRCLSESRLCGLKFLYYRHFYDLFATRDRVLNETRDPPERVYAVLLEQYLALLAQVVDKVRSWNGRVLIVTESFEYDSLRAGLDSLGVPYIALNETAAGGQVELAADGHWSAATHAFAAERVIAWLQRGVANPPIPRPRIGPTPTTLPGVLPEPQIPNRRAGRSGQ